MELFFVDSSTQFPDFNRYQFAIVNDIHYIKFLFCKSSRLLCPN